MIRTEMIRTLAAAVGVLAVSACVGPDADRAPTVAQIVLDEGDDPVITVPDTVTAGIGFEVAILAYSGRCQEPGFVKVSVADLHATVTPFNVDAEGPNCPGGLPGATRTANVTFARVGEGAITVVGANPDRSLLVVTRYLVPK